MGVISECFTLPSRFDLLPLILDLEKAKAELSYGHFIVSRFMILPGQISTQRPQIPYGFSTSLMTRSLMAS